MKKIRILDCTLRDGGYINNWKFGYENIKDTVQRLIQAGIDIIEVGYLSSKGDFSADESQYSSVDAIKKNPSCRQEKYSDCRNDKLWGL